MTMMTLVAAKIKEKIIANFIRENNLNNPKISLNKIEINSFKQEIFIINFKGFKKRYALHKTKTKNKLNEYLNCRKLKNSIFPKIYNIDKKNREVITEWIEGKKIASFKNDIYPKIVSQRKLNQIADLLAKLHSTLSQRFSPIEIDPIIIAPNRDTLKTAAKTKLFDNIIKNYNKSFGHLRIGQRKNDLRGIDINELKTLLKSGLDYLRKSRTTIESVPFFSLLHGDMLPENILFTKDNVRLIDFENMHYGDRAWELAFFFEEGEQADYINEKNKDKFLDRYCRSFRKFYKMNIDNNLKERIKVYQVFIVIKFLALICNGLASDGESINLKLYNDILSRAKNLLLKNNGRKK